MPVFPSKASVVYSGVRRTAGEIRGHAKSPDPDGSRQRPQGFFAGLRPARGLP